MDAGLWASRAAPLGVRWRFVFSVCRLVSRRCHNISTMSNWGQPPPRTGRAPLTHPAPHGYFPATQDAAFCKRSGYHRDSAAECGRCLVQLAITARPPSLHRGVPSGSARLRSTGLDFRLLRYYAAFRLPHRRLPPSPLRLVGHTHPRWIRAVGISLVALPT